VATICGKHQLVLGGKGAVTSYDPSTGNEIWRCRWAADRVANMVTFDSEHVFATNKHSDGEVICIKGDGSGDVSRTRLIWRQTKFGSELPSPMLQGDYLYVLSDEGLLSCLQSTTGKIEWKKRLEGVFCASPIIAGDYLICCSESGVATVLSIGATGSIVSVNPMSEGIVASPIVAGNSIFVRTLASLRCIGTAAPEPVAERSDTPRRRL
jgi:hypothetical protein